MPKKYKTTQAGLKKCPECGKLFMFTKRVKDHMKRDHNTSLMSFI